MDNVIVLNLKGCVSPQSYHNAGIACKYTTLRKLPPVTGIHPEPGL